MAEEAIAKPFDLAVIGTGIAASIVAAAAARRHLSVIHIDESDSYGGVDCTLTLHRFVEHHLQTGTRIIFPPAAVTEMAAVEAPDGWRIENDVAAPIAAVVSGPHIVLHCDDLSANLSSAARKVHIDLWPRLTYCRGRATTLLVDSGVSSYLEFKPLEADCLLSVETAEGPAQARLCAQPVPAGKGDVFSHSSLSLSDKRRLMKLLQFVLDAGMEASGESSATGMNEVSLGTGRTLLRPQNKGAPAYDLESFKHSPFSSFLSHAGIDGPLQAMLIHAVGLVDAQAQEQPTAARGVERLHAYVSSLGRYGACAFLCTMYGSGEVSQAFCRSCAVHGGVYMLRTKVTAWRCGWHEGGGERGVVGLHLLDDTGAPCTVHVRKVVVADASMLPDAWRSSGDEGGRVESEHLAVVVCVLSGPMRIQGLSGTPELLHAILPPYSPPCHAPRAIHLLQSGASACTAPRTGGYTVVHAVCRVAGGREGAEGVAGDMRTKLLPLLCQREGEGEGAALLWHAAYLIPVPLEGEGMSREVPSNVIVVPGHLSGEGAGYSYLTLDGPVLAASAVWARVGGVTEGEEGMRMFQQEKTEEQSEGRGEGDRKATPVQAQGEGEGAPMDAKDALALLHTSGALAGL